MFGAKAVKEVWYGGKKVWGKDEVVTITGDAQGGLRDALSARGLDYTTVKELPFGLDTSQVTNMDNMFYNCKGLQTVPQMNTSNVTSMNNMFAGCDVLQAVPQMNTSKVTGMNYMFSFCQSLQTVPQMDTSKVTGMNGMFYNCKALKDGSVKLIRNDGKKPFARNGMIEGSGLTREPFFLPNGTPI